MKINFEKILKKLLRPKKMIANRYLSVLRFGSVSKPAIQAQYEKKSVVVIQEHKNRSTNYTSTIEHSFKLL